MGDEAFRHPLEEILMGEPEGPSERDPLARYVVVTPRAISIFNLHDCLEQLERYASEPLRLVQAAKSLHLAMQTALTDALAGSASIGAFDEKLKAAYLAYFEGSREGEASPPEGDRVMSSRQLLDRALNHPMEWTGRSLKLSTAEKQRLEQLTFIRDRVEHPRPGRHSIGANYIALTMPIAARLTLELLDVCAHRYKDGERDGVASAVVAITDHCAKI